MATKPTTKGNAPKADNTKQAEWEFTSDFDTSIAPPPPAAMAPRSSQLPFIEKFFEPAKEHALKGEKPHKFIPKVFFLSRAQVAEDKVTGGYMKQKVRDQFNKWKKSLPEAEQDKLSILMFERKGGEEGFPDAGLSVWLVVAQG